MTPLRIALVFSLILVAISNVSSHSSEQSIFKTLEHDLQEIEILLKELDVQLSRDLAYGWREDVSDKINEWRDSVRSTFSRLRSSVRKFWSSLTTREGNRLPPWIYTAFGGALDDVMKYLEERLQHENDAFRTALLEVIKNTVRIYRSRIREASEKKEIEGTSTTQPTPTTDQPSPAQPDKPSQPQPDNSVEEVVPANNNDNDY